MDSRGGLRKYASFFALIFFVACGGQKPVARVAPAEMVEPPSPPPTPHELALRGLKAFDEQKWDESIATLNAAATQNPNVAPFLLLRVASAEEARGNAQQAAAIATGIANGPTTAATVARLRLPALLAATGDAVATDAAFAQAMLVPIDELTESDFVDLAKRLEKAGRIDLATTVRLRLLNDYTSGRFVEEVYGSLASELDKLSLDDSIALASKLSRANRYDQALDLFQRIAQRFPDAQTQDQYRAIRVRALFNSRNYTTLLDETRDVALDPSLMLLRARAAWRAGKPDEFLAGLDQIEKDFPESREAIDAKIQRARYYSSDVIDYAKAIDNLTQAIDAGALGNDGENLWTLGWTNVLAGQPDEALKIFDRYIAMYPDGDYRTNSLFWSAKVLDRLGRADERDAKAKQVVAEFPYSYYAYRAKELWPAAATAPASPNVFPDLVAELTLGDTARELFDLGLERDAAREMKALATQFPDDNAVQLELARIYVRAGEPFKANGILQRRFREFVRHGGANIPHEFWEILFPLPYLDTIRAEAAKRGLDPYLVASIIRQETGFEPTTVSNAGAVGLMQIMPAEAGAIAAEGGIEGVTRETLFDPATNIAVGTAELAQKIARMNALMSSRASVEGSGRVVSDARPTPPDPSTSLGMTAEILAIAAYNGGEEAVNRWLARTPIDDIDVFIESIPYAETKLYVKTVTRNRHEYKRIYG